MIEPDLIKRCQQGEEDAFNALYRQIGKKALWSVYLIVGSMSAAEDILQEVFFECFRDIKKLNNLELFQAWFNRILVRKSMHILSGIRKHPAESLDDGGKESIKDNYDLVESVEASQESLMIRKAVNRLSPAMRTTVILFYYSELSIKEISHVMNCFQGTVKSRLHYAKRVLGKELKEDFTDNCANAGRSI